MVYFLLEEGEGKKAKKQCQDIKEKDVAKDVVYGDPVADLCVVSCYQCFIFHCGIFLYADRMESSKSVSVPCPRQSPLPWLRQLVRRARTNLEASSTSWARRRGSSLESLLEVASSALHHKKLFWQFSIKFEIVKS